MSRARNRNSKRKEITIMTLLANESEKGARSLLKKYGKPDASNFEELEEKLAQLYFQTPDKLQLEKEMAAIHPHKKWLMKTLPPVIEVKEETKVIEVKPEEKSSFSAQPICKNQCPCGCGKSSFDGDAKEIVLKEKPMDSSMGLICLVAVVGITFYALNKSIK